jgi:hypothetical protein
VWGQPLIEAVNVRLQEWGRWSTARVDGGTGFFRQYNYSEKLPSAWHGSDFTPAANLRCLATEAGVGMLLKEHHRLGLAVTSYYRDHVDWGVAAQAAALGYCRGSLYRDIDRAHLVLLEFWDDHGDVKR